MIESRPPAEPKPLNMSQIKNMTASKGERELCMKTKLIWY